MVFNPCHGNNAGVELRRICEMCGRCMVGAHYDTTADISLGTTAVDADLGRLMRLLGLHHEYIDQVSNVCLREASCLRQDRLGAHWSLEAKIDFLPRLA